MIINQSKILKDQHKSRISIKTKLILLLLLTLVTISGIFYFYFQSTQTSLKNAKTQATKIQLLNQEIVRCNALIAENQGDFAQYEYCRRLLATFAQN